MDKNQYNVAIFCTNKPGRGKWLIRVTYTARSHAEAAEKAYKWFDNFGFCYCGVSSWCTPETLVFRVKEKGLPRGEGIKEFKPATGKAKKYVGQVVPVKGESGIRVLVPRKAPKSAKAAKQLKVERIEEKPLPKSADKKFRKAIEQIANKPRWVVVVTPLGRNEAFSGEVKIAGQFDELEDAQDFFVETWTERWDSLSRMCKNVWCERSYDSDTAVMGSKDGAWGAKIEIKEV